jgi:hypothetical protein
MPTKEVINGQWVTRNEPFRTYTDASESARDYLALLNRNKRYSPVLTAGSLDDAITAMGKSGYATDPGYAAKLRSIKADNPYVVERYNDLIKSGASEVVAQLGARQAALESAHGKSGLAAKHGNHWGIKNFGGKSSPQQPTNMPASPRQLGYETAAVQRGIQSPDLPGYGAGARWLDNKLGVTGDSPMSRAEQLVGRLGLSSTPRTSVQNQGFNDQAGPIPASQRPAQAATSANPRGYRPQARGGAGGMLAGLASAMMGGGDEGGAHVPHMPMDTNDYHSRSVQQSQVHSDRLSQLLQERWSKAMAPQTTPEEEMV